MHLVARSTPPVKCRNDFHHGGCYNCPQPPDCGMELSSDLRIVTGVVGSTGPGAQDSQAIEE